MRKLVSTVLLVSVPAFCFLFPFACGFFNLPQVYIMLLLPLMVFGPPMATGVAAFLSRSSPRRTYVWICLGLYAAVFAVFFVGPAGAAKWTVGFAYNVRLTKNPARIQDWATHVLARYEAGKLDVKPKAEYWAAGKESLSDKEIPDHIRNLWRERPTIGVATMTADGWMIDPNQTNSVSPNGEATTRVHCVAFSWYLTGLLVGPPDFKPTWNPWYTREIIPGVYAFSGKK
jgi:hypothetical protein